MARAGSPLLVVVALLAASLSAIHARALDAVIQKDAATAQSKGPENRQPEGAGNPHGAEFDLDRLVQEAQRQRQLSGYVRPATQFTDRPVVGIVTLPITVPSQRKFGPSSFATSYARWVEAGGARVVPIFYDSTKEELDFLLPRYAARAPQAHYTRGCGGCSSLCPTRPLQNKENFPPDFFPACIQRRSLDLSRVPQPLLRPLPAIGMPQVCHTPLAVVLVLRGKCPALSLSQKGKGGVRALCKCRGGVGKGFRRCWGGTFQSLRVPGPQPNTGGMS